MASSTTKTLHPGQPGTQKYLKQYGDALICVRYRYDHLKNRKLKTIELIVENEPWQVNARRIPANKLVGVEIHYGEIHLARVVRQAGGRWNREKKLWELPYQQATSLGFEDRIRRL